MTDDYTDTDASPSQAALDAQLAGQKAIQAAQYSGQLGLARSQIQDAVADGGDAAVGRDLLGRLDSLQEFGSDMEDPVALYAEHKKFLRSTGAAPSSQPSAPPKKVIDKNKARRDYVDGKTNVYPG